MAADESSVYRTLLCTALTAVLDCVTAAQSNVEYRLVGTAAALLHAVDLPTRDVDILLRHREDVDAWGSALRSFPCLRPPTWLPDAHQYFGSYDVGGVPVELSTVEVRSSADTIETFGSGPWQHFTLLPCGGYEVPTVALELRLITELWRNRAYNYQQLIRHMQVNGCDLVFLRRGLAAAGISEVLQRNALAQLRSAPHVSIPG